MPYAHLSPTYALMNFIHVHTHTYDNMCVFVICISCMYVNELIIDVLDKF